MPGPQSASTIEYTLLAVFVICAVLGLFEYVWPVLDVLIGDFTLLGEALAGTK